MHKTLSAWLALCLAAAPLTARADAPPAPPAAPLAELVRTVDIPYERFTLNNGLTVLVHTDRKAPIIGVTTYYRVGSKHEPRGRTGFAHLYEHLFFGGSANAPGFDAALEAAGSSQTNGSTWFDRTNYVETVPKGALELALFLESDRMGHLLPAVTQDKLDKQRGVVENEKRQGDNRPYGLMAYAVGEGLFPVGHPYRHSPIGSLADLEAATLGDVRAWFRDHYGPNNAVLVLSGDIDAATARPLVERWFGDIPAGPAVQPVVAGPVTLAAPVRRELTDQVPAVRLVRYWSGPAMTDPDAEALELGMSVLGGLASSRLDNALVRGRQLAASVSANVEQHEQLSLLSAEMEVKEGVARAGAEAAFDAEIARLVREGPRPDELARAATRAVAAEIAGLEMAGGFSGKGATLAEGLMFTGDPAHYKARLARLAALTPQDVQAALARWLGRPPLMIAVSPGPRQGSGDALGGWGDEAGRPAPPPDPRQPVAALPPGPARTAPAVAPVGPLTFPTLERARLANGIPVTFARRGAVPTLEVQIAFDAGIAADFADTPGTQSMMLAMLDQGTSAAAKLGALGPTALLEAEERLGASIRAGAAMDTSAVTLSALSANLGPSLALLADVVRHPAFAPADVARVADQRLATLAQTLASPQGLALHRINALLYGPGHPYAAASDGLGSAEAIRAQTSATLAAAHRRWLRPDRARITVVGDVDMANLLPRLEAAFGDWRVAEPPPPAKPIDRPGVPARPRIVLLDRPNSPQSLILGGKLLGLTGRTAGQEPLELANEVLGGDFLSRLNSDLREDKGWSYGVSTYVRQPLGERSLLVLAPVEAPRTGDAIKAIVADMQALAGPRPVTPEELQRTTEGNVRGLPNRYETNAQVLDAIALDQRLGRPADYTATLPARLAAVTAPALDAAARRYLRPEPLVLVVVGDAKVVGPQLKGLGLPVEMPDSTATNQPRE